MRIYPLLIVVAASLPYLNTFEVPFVFDDIRKIRENPLLREIGNFLSLEVMNDHRYIGKLSFALNYAIHGPDVTGYHLVNLLIHVLNGLLVYWTVLYTFKTPALNTARIGGEEAALFTALLFVVHPLQTQAVTYIVQRYTSLATLFYLCSLFAYVKWRLGERGYWYHIGLISAVLGMKTKEIVCTLPLALLVYEMVFFPGGTRTRYIKLLPYALTILLVPLSFVGKAGGPAELITEADRLTRVSRFLGRQEYMLTELRVLVTYLRLVFIPAGQNLDYDYRVSRSLLEWQVLGSSVLLGLLLLSGIYMVKKGKAEARLAGYGILWFFMAHAVEVAVVLPDVIFEHRMYLPMYGVTVALVVLMLRAGQSMKRRSLVKGLLLVVVSVLAVLTYQRNRVWGDEVRLWEDVVSKSPGKSRPHYNLGLTYHLRGELQKAAEEYRKAITLNPEDPNPYINLGQIYHQRGALQKAMELYRTAINLSPDDALAHFNLGLVYLELGETTMAKREFERVLAIEPDNYHARALLRKIDSP